ncbi:hypothetical protein [Clostridium estertheticum]|uniref:hypothetical protein n=1 Tax=Clostridium estertheticum TaxID=238834 RepID=UPI001C7DE51D|nr:hypothetical protein [Clostridium estertheticum]MBX4266207.1 hypothetical protein [Clostridium estertheticum]WLC89910.1 hypothetical protein KTC95_06880 [Clostridium estertheticum]
MEEQTDIKYSKEQSNPFSTGGGGVNYEIYVQTYFTCCMLLGWNIPGMNGGCIDLIKLQGRYEGYDVDDCVLYFENESSKSKLMCQIKHSLALTENDKTFKDVLTSAWNNYNNKELFDRRKDCIALVVAGLSATDIKNARIILEWARTCDNENEFIKKVYTSGFSSKDKQKKYEAFKNHIITANSGNVEDKEVWLFLKKFYILVLELDTPESPLNVAMYSALCSSGFNNNTFDVLFRYVSNMNQNAGTISFKTFPDKIVSKVDYSKLYLYKDYQKLEQHSKLILTGIHNSVAGITISREKTLLELSEKLEKMDLLLITGERGVGKSGIVKQYIEKYGEDNYGIIFRAEELNYSHLQNVLSNIGITSTTQELKDSLSLFSGRYLFIESLEKLLEFDNTKAFLDLLSIISQQKRWKIVATVRNYAVQQVIMNFISKYPIKYDIVQIERFSEEQINVVINSVEVLNGVKNNIESLAMIQNPFYLDFVYRTLNSGYVLSPEDTKQNIKNAIWEVIVEKGSERTDGLPQKRNKCFTQIALKRAKTMKYAVDEEEYNEEALLKLEEDELILRKDGLVCLAHDVLEDWALERFIDKKYRTNSSDISTFLAEIGHEQSICRAYRLWLDNQFEDVDFTNKYIKDFFEVKGLQSIWYDETLAAVIYGNRMNNVLSTVHDLMFDDECKLLKRVCFIIRVSAKRPDMRMMDLLSESKDKKLTQHVMLKPYGDCWKQIIEFLFNEKSNFPHSMYSHCINMLDEWSRLINVNFELPESSREAGLLSFYLLDKIKDKYYSSKNEVEKLFSVAIMTYNSIPKEFTQFIETTVFDEEKRKHHSYIDVIAEQLCSGIYCAFIAKNAPDILIRVAKREWLLQEQPGEKITQMMMSSSSDIDHYFGINHRSVNDYFPASGEREPFRSLFRFVPKIATDFIIEICNIAAESYANSNLDFDGRQKGLIDSITYSINVNEGKNIKQYATARLWSAYRGMSVTPYVIQSGLMELENWLINHFEHFKENKNEVDYCVNYLITKSNSVLVTAVVASVVIPYYKYLGDSVLMLLQNNDFYSMDVSRSVQEMGDKELNWFSLNNNPLKNLYISDRRKAANRPWRKETLESLCVKLQFTSSRENVLQVIDEINQILKYDVEWRFRFNRLNTRGYTYEYDEQQSGYICTSKEVNDVDLVEIGEASTKKGASMHRFIGITLWVEEAIKGNAKFDIYKTPRDVFSEIKDLLVISDTLPNDEKFFASEGANIKAIVVLYIDFRNDFTNDEVNWCREFVTESFEKYDAKLRDVTSTNKLDTYGMLAIAEIIPLFSDDITEKRLFELLAKGLTCCDMNVRYATAKGIKKALWSINKDLADECIKLVIYFSAQESKKQRFIWEHYYAKGKRDEYNYYKWFLKERSKIICKKVFLISEIKKEEIPLVGITLRMLMLCPDYHEKYRDEVLENIIRISQAEKEMNDHRNDDRDKIDRYYSVIEYNTNAVGKYLVELDIESLKYLCSALEQACQDGPNFTQLILSQYDYLVEQSGNKNRYWIFWGLLSEKMREIAKQLCKGENYQYDERSKLLQSYMYVNIHWQPIDFKNQSIKDGVDLICGFAKETAGNPIVFEGVTSLMYYFPELILEKGIIAITNITEEKIVENLQRSGNSIFYLENVLHTYVMNIEGTTIESRLYCSCEKLLNALVEMASANAYYVREYLIKSKKIR